MKIYFKDTSKPGWTVETLYVHGDSENPLEHAVYELLKTGTAFSVTITFYGFSLYYEKVN